jgi:D-sedoheptulose 7-phosphate isomerase
VIWSTNVDEIAKCLQLLTTSGGDAKLLDSESAFSLWTDWTVQIREQKRTIFLIGNGASASMASHVAADLAKNAHVHTEVFTDLALITAIANDMSFQEIFSEPLKRRLVPGDMVIAISSSGRSENILQAAETTRKLDGKVVTLSAMNSENPLRRLGDLNFYIPAQTYGMAETSHAAILHYWIDRTILTNQVTKGAPR